MIITMKATVGGDRREETIELDYDGMDINFVMEEIIVLLTRFGYKIEDIQDAILDRAEEIADARMET